MSSISAGTTSTTTLIHSGDTTGSLVFKTNDTGSGGTTAVTINTSQNVGIGTTSPSATLDIVKSTGPSVRIGPSTGTSYGYLSFSNTGGNFNIGRESSTGGSLLTGSSAYASVLNSFGAYPMQFGTNGSLAMTIDSGQNLLVGTTSQLQSALLSVLSSQANQAVYVRNSNATPGGIVVNYSVATPNNTGSEFFFGNDPAQTRVTLRSNGGIANYSANNVNLSDRREKTNFAPAKSYLNVICAIPVQTFNYLDQNLKEDDGLTLGVVAQDVQAVAPELVSESDWSAQKDGSKMRLSIYQTDLQYALMKSIQELKAINDQQAETINALTARVVALEGK